MQGYSERRKLVAKQKGRMERKAEEEKKKKKGNGSKPEERKSECWE